MGTVPTPERTSVHHPGIRVVLELDQIVGRITEHEGPMHLDQSFETRAEFAEHLDLALDAKMVNRLEVLDLAKGHTEVTWVEVEGLGRLDRRLGEVAYQLIAEEV